MQHNIEELKEIDNEIINFLKENNIFSISEQTKCSLTGLSYVGFLHADKNDLKDFGFKTTVALNLAAHIKKIAANKRIVQLEQEIGQLRQKLTAVLAVRDDEPGAVGGNFGSTSKAIALNDKDKLITQFQNNLAIGNDERGAVGDNFGSTSKAIALNDAKKPIKKSKSMFKRPPKVKLNYYKPNITPKDTLTSEARRSNCRGGNVTNKASNNGPKRYPTVLGSLSLPAGARYEKKAKSQIRTNG